MIKSAAKKTLIGTLGAASLLVAGTQVAHADTVKVQSGDTVWAYSQKYHVSIDSIVKANKLADANLIIAGHSLNIPGVSTSDASQTSTAASTATATTSTATSAASQATTQSSTASSVAASSAVSSSLATSAASSTATSTTAASSVSSASGSTTVQSNGSSAQVSNTRSSRSTSTSQTSAARAGGVATALAIANGNTPYVYGGNTLAGFDCSGLVQYAYGLSARTTTQQATLGAHHYDVQNAPYGALLFWGSDSAPYHVAISLGNGNYVAAQNSQKGIGTFSQTYWKASFYINY